MTDQHDRVSLRVGEGDFARVDLGSVKGGAGSVVTGPAQVVISLDDD